MNCHTCNKEIDKIFTDGIFTTDKGICESCYLKILGDKDFIEYMSTKVYDEMWSSFTELPTNKFINDNVYSNEKFKKLCNKIIKDNSSKTIPYVNFGSLYIE